MTRFAWLQTRTQSLSALGLIGALAALAAVTGIQLSHLYHRLVLHCTTGCGLATDQFLRHDRFMGQALELLARAVPAVLGIFWGAPLIARELESGTFRLALTQGVSRRRWVLTKLALGALGTATIAGLLTLTITWWYRSVDKVSTTPFSVFDRRDVVPIGYAVFAFALGALAGVIIRRTVPAMAATLGGFVVARVVTSVWVRPHLLSPVRSLISLAGAGPDSKVQLGVGSSDGSSLTLFAEGGGPSGSWNLSSHLATNSGHQLSSGQIAAFLHQHCPDVGLPPVPPPGGGVARVIGPDAGKTCLDEVARTFHLAVTYQPANRYWTFQWLELGIFGLLALACAAGTYWWVTRRAT